MDVNMKLTAEPTLSAEQPRAAVLTWIMLLLYILFLQDWVVAVADQAGALGFGVFYVNKGAELHAEKLVGARSDGYEGWVLFFLQGIDQGVGIVLLADGGDLNEVSAGCGSTCCGRICRRLRCRLGGLGGGIGF